MTSGKKCKCKEPKWKILQYKCNYSYFEYPKGEYHHSNYSLLKCENCDACWRTKANYVEKILKEQENGKT